MIVAPAPACGIVFGEVGASSPWPALFFEDLCVNNRARRSALGGLQLQACALGDLDVFDTVYARLAHSALLPGSRLDLFIFSYAFTVMKLVGNRYTLQC